MHGFGLGAGYYSDSIPLHILCPRSGSKSKNKMLMLKAVAAEFCDLLHKVGELHNSFSKKNIRCSISGMLKVNLANTIVW